MTTVIFWARPHCRQSHNVIVNKWQSRKDFPVVRRIAFLASFATNTQIVSSPSSHLVFSPTFETLLKACRLAFHFLVCPSLLLWPSCCSVCEHPLLPFSSMVSSSLPRSDSWHGNDGSPFRFLPDGQKSRTTCLSLKVLCNCLVFGEESITSAMEAYTDNLKRTVSMYFDNGSRRTRWRLQYPSKRNHRKDSTALTVSSPNPSSH